jgi:hypothetical protein
MKKHKGSSSLMLIFWGVFLSMNTGEIYADETNLCTISCASDLKQCRRNADLAANYGAHPIINDARNVENITLMNGRGVQFNSPNAEIEKRKNEIYQRCETEYNNCLRQCMTEQGTESRAPKNSVIFKSLIHNN